MQFNAINCNLFTRSAAGRSPFFGLSAFSFRFLPCFSASCLIWNRNWNEKFVVCTLGFEPLFFEPASEVLMAFEFILHSRFDTAPRGFSDSRPYRLCMLNVSLASRVDKAITISKRLSDYGVEFPIWCSLWIVWCDGQKAGIKFCDNRVKERNQTRIADAHNEYETKSRFHGEMFAANLDIILSSLRNKNETACWDRSTMNSSTRSST